MSVLQTLFHIHTQAQPKNLLASEQKTYGYHSKPLGDPQEIFFEAGSYLHLFHQESGKFATYAGRLAEIHGRSNIAGTIGKTMVNLPTGAKFACVIIRAAL